jgi:hypothetical protein
MSETLNTSNNKEQTTNGKLLICACSEGEERSVFANKLFKEHGQNSKVLPGGLAGLTEYLTGKSDPGKMQRLINRGISDAFVIRGEDHSREYDRLLQKDATWLLFIGSGDEAKDFKELIKILKSNYGLEIIITNCWDKKSTAKRVEEFLEKK